MSEDRLEDNLLAELRALEVSRSRYQMEHPGALLGAEDPDVRRMIEAMAYSAVRTRMATTRNLHATWRRLLSSYFQFILQPLPAMTIARAVPTARMSESVVLPRGANLELLTLDGFPGNFVTLAELRIVPMTLSRCEIMMRRQGFRLVLTFDSQYQRGDDIGLLRLYVHYLDNYLAALRVQWNLQTHLQKCSVFYDTAFLGDTPGTPCEVIFGPHYDEPYEAEARNPLEQARDFFHFPEQDLLINIRVPPAQRTWRQVSICFDLDQDWPRDPPIYREIFHPFAVPVMNIRRSFAQPIEADGTQDMYPIRYLTEDPSFAVHRTLGVYRTTDEGIEPLRAAVLGDIRPTYEIEEQSYFGGGTGYALSVQMPQAFGNPQRLLVDATWHQPEFARHAVGPIQTSLLDRSVIGLDWQIIGAVRAPQGSPLRQSPDQLLYLLSLKMKPTLELDELLQLLSMFGSVDAGIYRELPRRLRALHVEVVPDGNLQGAGIRHIYHLLMEPHEREEAPLHARFLAQLGTILDAWDYEARVEIRAKFGSETQLMLPAATAPREPVR